MRAPLDEALFAVRLEDLGQVEPLAGGTVEFPIPPEVGPQGIVRMRYMMYLCARGLFFDFIRDDVTPLPVPVQAWIWVRREVLHHQLTQHAAAFFNGPDAPRPPVQ